MHSNKPDKNQYPALFKSKRLIAFFAILLLVTSSVFGFSKTAHAGLLSFISKILGNQEVSAKLLQPLVIDSQTSSAIVLQASSNAAQPVQASDTPPLENDTTLSPDLASMNATSTEDINTQISIYVVRSGDTISSVAKMFDVSVNTILWANNLGGRATLKPGQTLVILPVTGITYTIKSKDTIKSIAKKYNADVTDILNYNDLTLSSALQVGDQIVIPDAEITTPAVSAPRRITKVSSEPILDGWGWPSYPGYYACPVPGSRISQGLHGHNAIDLAAPRGTPIYAAAGGTVIIDRSNGAWNGGYGNFVVILHSNGTQTLYAHMSKSTVRDGETVSKDQVIGHIGMTGLTTGPHVHFEVRGAQNPAVDPAFCQ